MRHLIHRHEDYFLVGLKDRAYLIFDGGSDTKGTIVELLPTSIEDSKPTAVATTEKPATNDDKEKDNEKEKNDDNKTTNEGQDGDQQQQPQTEQQQQQQPQPQPQQQKPSSSELNEICAVAITGETKDAGTTLRCVVSRNNKSMDVYTIDPTQRAESESKAQSQSPALNYRTPKRVSCFVFVTLAATDNADDDDDDDGKGKGTENTTLLISGDVAGDSHAYNLESRGQKLLLGHTASMLTDIATAKVNDSNGNDQTLLLTSDRDEKIRISRFPESTVVEGFLLGHTAYVTGVAVVAPSSSSSSPLVVSCGGDRTIRLWNLSTRGEICCLSTVSTEIPTAIAVSPCGTRVAVIFDESNRLSLYQINTTTTTTTTTADSTNTNTNTSTSTSTPSLELLGSVDCPSRPLAVQFSKDAVVTIVTKDPDYLVQYDIPGDGSKAVVAVPKDVTPAMKALRELASGETIAMPSTILEKDDFGNPVLQKENETRGPAASDQPWNRVERVDIAKERGKRRKKKAKFTAAVETS